MNTSTLDLVDGLHVDVPFGAYHAVDAVSASALKSMRRGPPARVLWERANPSPDTDATRLGTAVHCAFITPEVYEALYVVKPEGMSFASNVGKAWRDDPIRKGKELVSFDTGELVHGICAALEEKQPVYESLIRAKYREAVILNRCPETGERVKARPDWIDPVGKGYIVDLKVCSKAERGAESLAYTAYSQGWFHQLAWYRFVAGLHGMPVDGGRLVVVDPKPPHYVHLLEVRPNALDLCALENEKTLKAMQACRVAGSWPGTPDEWAFIEAPIFNESDVSALTGAEEVVDG